MAFKKNAETGKTTNKEGKTYATKWYTLDEVISKAEAKEKTVLYTLANDITLDVNAEKMWANINYCGCSFFAQIKERKDGGYFLSFPSYKKKDGSWEDIVSIYDKGFHSLVKELLAKIAEE